MENDLLYSMKDVAKILKVSLPHAYVIVKKHRIPVIPLGPRCTRISKLALEEWVRRQNADYFEERDRF